MMQNNQGNMMKNNQNDKKGQIPAILSGDEALIKLINISITLAQEDPQNCLPLLQKAIDYANKIENSSKKAELIITCARAAIDLTQQNKEKKQDLLLKAIKILSADVVDVEHTTERIKLLAEAYSDYIDSLIQSRTIPMASAFVNKGVQILEAALSQNTQISEELKLYLQRKLGAMYQTQGNLYVQDTHNDLLSNKEKALKCFQKAWERLVSTSPQATQDMKLKCDLLVKIATVRVDIFNLTKSWSLLSEAHNTYQEALQYATSRVECGMIYNLMGRVLSHQGENQQAIDCYSKSLNEIQGLPEVVHLRKRLNFLIAVSYSKMEDKKNVDLYMKNFASIVLPVSEQSVSVLVGLLEDSLTCKLKYQGISVTSILKEQVQGMMKELNIIASTVEDTSVLVLNGVLQKSEEEKKSKESEEKNHDNGKNSNSSGTQGGDSNTKKQDIGEGKPNTKITDDADGNPQQQTGKREVAQTARDNNNGKCSKAERFDITSVLGDKKNIPDDKHDNDAKNIPYTQKTAFLTDVLSNAFETDEAENPRVMSYLLEMFAAQIRTIQKDLTDFYTVIVNGNESLLKCIATQANLMIDDSVFLPHTFFAPLHQNGEMQEIGE